MIRSPPGADGVGTPGGPGWRVLGQADGARGGSGQFSGEEELEKVWEGGSSVASREVCKGCDIRVGTGQMGLECEMCQHWFHAKCEEINKKDYELISKVIDKVSWHCSSCHSLAFNIMDENKKLRLQVDDMKQKLEGMKAEIVVILRAQERAEKLETTVTDKIEAFSMQMEAMKKDQELVRNLGKRVDQDMKDKLVEIDKLIEKNRNSVVTEVSGINRKMEQRIIELQEGETLGRADKGENISKLKEELERVKRDIIEGGTDNVRNIQQQVERIERDSRRKNLVLFNLAESNKDSSHDRYKEDEELCLALIRELGMHDLIFENLIRLGRKIDGKVRPVLVKFKEENEVKRILQAKSQLRNITTFKKVYVDRDLSFTEREINKKLRNELYTKRNSDENAKYIISRGRVVEIVEECQEGDRRGNSRGAQREGSHFRGGQIGSGAVNRRNVNQTRRIEENGAGLHQNANGGR